MPLSSSIIDVISVQNIAPNNSITITPKKKNSIYQQFLQGRIIFPGSSFCKKKKNALPLASFCTETIMYPTLS